MAKSPRSGSNGPGRRFARIYGPVTRSARGIEKHTLDFQQHTLAGFPAQNHPLPGAVSGPDRLEDSLTAAVMRDRACRADLRAIAATTLRRLAVEMRADTSCAACVHFTCTQMRVALAETRREAVADLEQLRQAMPSGSDPRATIRQAFEIDTGNALADEIDAWAAAWEASP